MSLPTVWILGDQLTLSHPGLLRHPPGSARVLLIESWARARQRPYHKQKLVLVWSALRHFAEELRLRGYDVDHHPACRRYADGLRAHLRQFRPSSLLLMESAEVGGSERLAGLARSLGAEVEILPNRQFLSDEKEFQRWARGRKTLRMENFYRDMRRRTRILLEDGEPAGGTWNFDPENRQRPPRGHRFPALPSYPPDAITREVIELVEREFPHHFGEVESFAWPVTRADAEHFRDDFLRHRLDLFGPYEDAIVQGERALYHSLLSPVLNLGLLEPLDLCQRAEAEYRAGRARLASVEGFVRQILGWREFVRQVYLLDMPGYLLRNELGADLPLPDFYWTGDTDMACVAEAVTTVRRHAMNHHIQRLMVTGNFALLAGIDPQAVNEWYWFAYADAYEWVVTPNVLGMALFADGGRLASKPYAAGANYLNRMGDHCRGCRYDPRQTVGPDACPFNSLYWAFLDRHRERFAGNPRLTMPLATWRRRSETDRSAILVRAEEVRNTLRRSGRL